MILLNKHEGMKPNRFSFCGCSMQFAFSQALEGMVSIMGKSVIAHKEWVRDLVTGPGV
jgi:hypothetical protein